MHRRDMTSDVQMPPPPQKKQQQQQQTNKQTNPVKNVYHKHKNVPTGHSMQNIYKTT